MLNLSNDILYHIFHQIWRADRSSLIGVMLVCKHWQSISQRILHNHIDNIVICPERVESNMRLFTTIKSRDSIRSAIRKITVRDVFCSGTITGGSRDRTLGGEIDSPYGELEPRSQVTWDQLKGLAEALSVTKLAVFIWSARPRMPTCLLQVLHTLQCDIETHLREDYHERRLFYMPCPSLETVESISAISLTQSKLTKLGVVIPAVSWHGFDHNLLLKALGQLISKAPLRSIQIHGAMRALYGRPHTIPSTAPYEIPTGTIRHFDWITTRIKSPLQLTDLRLTNMCLCEANDRTLMELRHVVRWGNLKTAHFTCARFLDFLSQEGSRLRSLKLEFDAKGVSGKKSCAYPTDLSRVRRFLRSQAQLQDLEITNEHPSLFFQDTESDNRLLQQIGCNLYSLVIRTHEEFQAHWLPAIEREIPSKANVQVLGLACPHLRHLTIDAPWEDDELQAYSEVIHRYFPSLQYLEFILTLEIPGQYPGRTPFTLQRCVDLWKHLQNLSSDRKSPLRELRVAIGALYDTERGNLNLAGSGHRQRRLFVRAKGEDAEKNGDITAGAVEIEEFDTLMSHDKNAAYGMWRPENLHHLHDIIENGLRTRRYEAHERQTVCARPIQR